MFDLISPLLAFVAAYVALAWLLRRDKSLPLDHPNERSLHATPVPRIGGLGIMAGVLSSALVLRHEGLATLFAVTFALGLLSLLDDVRGLSVRIRLPSHMLAAAAFLMIEGGNSISGYLLGMLLIVWMTNAYNFMDGADGLAGGMAVTGFVAYGVAAWLGGEQEMALVCLSISAAALAFLRFNFPPARMFMGDSGSIPLGFLAAGMGWLGIRDGLWSPWFPLLVFSPFILDASVTLAARLGRGEKVWQAHRSHYYQRLVRMGWSHRRLAFTEYAVMVAASVSGLLLVLFPLIQFEMLAIWGVGYMLAMAAIDRSWREAVNAH